MDANIPFSLHIAQSGDIPAWMALVDLIKENFPGLDMEDYHRTLEFGYPTQKFIYRQAGRQQND